MPEHQSTPQTRKEPDPKEQMDEVERLRIQVAYLSSQIERMTTNDAIADVIGYGFRDVVAKLQPLRDMGMKPNGEALPRKTALALKRLRETLASPDWSNAGALPIPENPVPWIGQANDADGDEAFDPEDRAFAEDRRVKR